MANDDIREKVNRYLIKETNFLKVKDTMNDEELRKFVNQSILDLCQQKHKNNEEQFPLFCQLKLKEYG